MKIENKHAVITGAGSGIGRAIAVSLARRGCHLALIDINADALAETEDLIQQQEPELIISTHILDVSDRTAVKALPDDVLQHHPGIDMLINNAGIGAGGRFQQLSESQFDRVMRINFQAVVDMTRAFLPYLQKRKAARIVNVSSLFGLVSVPEQSVYAASKFAVRGFSNALRFELEGTNVGVTVVHPGGVNTNIVRSALIPEEAQAEEVERKQKARQKLLKMPPESAGEIIVSGIEKGKARILVGIDAKVIALIERLFPVSYWKILRFLMGLRSK